MSKSLETYVALLRGVNVGGNNIVSMADLKRHFEQAGFLNVSTFINSGNIIFRTVQSDPYSLEERIEAMLGAAYPFPISVVVRSLAAITELTENLPASWKAADGLKCNVIFLRRAIDSPDLLKGFNPKTDIEEVIYRPGVVFWSARTSDLTRSDMIKLASRPVYKEMTIRILNTVLKLRELMRRTDALDPAARTER